MHPKTFKTLRNWFDLELKPFLGIDVFQAGFPWEAGYTVVETAFARLFVYRFEALPQLPKLLTEFLGWKIPILVHSNISESKKYSQQYSLVKKHLRSPHDFLSSIYSGKMMQHFYSPHERRSWETRWSEVQRGPAPADATAQNSPAGVASRPGSP